MPCKKPKMGRRQVEAVPAEVQSKVVQALLSGNYLETAAAYAGISRDTYYRWLRKGAREKAGPFQAFAAAVKKALADAEVRDVARVAKAAEASWQASAWRLERKFPERWGRRGPKGYSAAQFTAFVLRVGELVKKYVPRDKRGTLAKELEVVVTELEKQRVGRAA